MSTVLIFWYTNFKSDCIRSRLKDDVAESSRHSTSTQKGTIEDRRVTLLRRIAAFRSVQSQLLPLSVTPDVFGPERPEDWPLHLPSGAPSEAVVLGSPLHHLGITEARLCFAQAMDTLVELRRSLFFRVHLTTFKGTQRGQAANTRARTLLDNAETKTKIIAARYRRARQAYVNLTPGVSVPNGLEILESEHIRPLQPEEPTRAEMMTRSRLDHEGEGHRKVSWIWMQDGVSTENGGDLNDGMSMV